MKPYLHRMGTGSESGSALVATVGVAMVGIALSVIVVTQAISITNDAARDRVRTVEVHAAELALDVSLRTLETTTPCSTTMNVSEGTTEVDVTVGIEYYDVSGALLHCDLATNTLTGDPVKAVVTSTAVPVQDTPSGVAPARKVQATVKLVPQTAPSLGVAMFASGSLGISNTGTVQPLDPNEPAVVWVENTTEFKCDTSVKIDADLIVTDGKITMSNQCVVTGDAWARFGFRASNNPPPNSYRIGGDLTVFNGDLANGTSQKYGGSVSVDGRILEQSFTSVGPVCSDNIGSPCTVLPEYTKRGLPVVEYDPSDWPSSFQSNVKSGTQFATDVINGGSGMSSGAASQLLANPCNLDNQIKNPINFTHNDTIYNLLGCAPLKVNNGITFVLYADTVFFVNGFEASNTFTILSGDGAQHDVWILVPSNLTGSIKLSNTSTIIDPIHVFMFTPRELIFANTQKWSGQAYGKDVKGSNSLTFNYVGMGIPGVDLSSGFTSTTPAGYSIEIVNKKEMHN